MSARRFYAKLVSSHKPVFLLFASPPNWLKHMLCNFFPELWLRQSIYLVQKESYIRDTKLQKEPSELLKVHQVMVDGKIDESGSCFNAVGHWSLPI